MRNVIFAIILFGLFASATVYADTPPIIVNFSADPASIVYGQVTLLSWHITGASSASIDNGLGDIYSFPSGSFTPAPIVNTTYTLTATNSAGSVSKNVTVTVQPNNQPCTDSDGGLDYYTRGAGTGIYQNSNGNYIYGYGRLPVAPRPTNDSYSTYYDYCANSYLNEPFCTSNGLLSSASYLCPDGCYYGACVQLNSSFSIITSSPLPNAKANLTYSVSIAASQGTNETNKWTVKSGTLPPGLNLVCANTNCVNANGSAYITGRPTSIGTYTFTMEVYYAPENGGTFYTSKEFRLTVDPNSSNTTTLSIITSSPLPGGRVTVRYDTFVSASGGADSDSYTWNVTSGSLPSGLSLAAADCVTAPCKLPAEIQGTPSVTGTSNFTLTVRTSNQSASKLFTLTITNSTTNTTNVTCTDSDGGINYYIKGVTTGINNNSGMLNTSEDHCLAVEGLNSSMRLKEFYCFDSQRYTSVIYNCSNGCNNGTCISNSSSIRTVRLGEQFWLGIQSNTTNGTVNPILAWTGPTSGSQDMRANPLLAFTTPGNYTVSVNAAMSMRVRGVSGGGGGGGGDRDGVAAPGGGGGAVNFEGNLVNLVPGTTYQVIVGAGGVAGLPDPDPHNGVYNTVLAGGGDGGNSSFRILGGTIYIYLSGGSRGGAYGCGPSPPCDHNMQGGKVIAGSGLVGGQGGGISGYNGLPHPESGVLTTGGGGGGSGGNYNGATIKGGDGGNNGEKGSEGRQVHIPGAGQSRGGNGGTGGGIQIQGDITKRGGGGGGGGGGAGKDRDDVYDTDQQPGKPGQQGVITLQFVSASTGGNSPIQIGDSVQVVDYHNMKITLKGITYPPCGTIACPYYYILEVSLPGESSSIILAFSGPGDQKAFGAVITLIKGDSTGALFVVTVNNGSGKRISLATDKTEYAVNGLVKIRAVAKCNTSWCPDSFTAIINRPDGKKDTVALTQSNVGSGTKEFSGIYKPDMAGEYSIDLDDTSTELYEPAHFSVSGNATGNLTTEDLLEIVFKLENMKRRIDGFQRNALDLERYYTEHGDTVNANKFHRVAEIFGTIKDKIDAMILEIRNNLDNPSAVIDDLRNFTSEVRALLRQIFEILAGG